MQGRFPGDATAALGAIAEGSPLAMAATEGATHLVRYANPAFCRLAGRAEGAVIGRPLAEIVPALQARGAVALLDRVYATGAAGQATDLGPARAGLGGPHDTYVVWPILGDDRRPAGLLVQVSDTTDQVLAREHAADAATEIRDVNQRLLVAGLDAQEQVETQVALNTALREAAAALRDSERRFHAIFDQAATGIAQTDLDGRFVLVNNRYSEIVGRPTAELAGICMQDLTHPEDLPRNRELFARMLAEGTDFTIEKRYVRPDGSAVWVRNAVARLDDPDGSARYAVAVVQDVSAEKAAEDALRESERRFRGIFDSAAVSIWEEDFSAVKALLEELKAGGVADLGAYLDERPDVLRRAVQLVRIVDVNEQTLRLFDAQSKAELLASLETIFIPETLPVFRDELVAIFEGRRTFASEAPIRTIRGERRDVVFTMAFPAPGAAFDSVLVSRMDVTPQKRAERDRERPLAAEREARALAEDAVRARDQFLSVAAHELRTPLTAIKGTAQLGLRAHARGTLDLERAEKTLRAINQMSDRLNVLTNDLLDVSRIQGGQLTLRRERLDLAALVQDVVDRHAVRLEEDHVLDAELPDRPVWVEADVVRLEQVFENLLSNAVKYSPAGGAVEVTLVQDADGARVAVKDTGIGLPEGAAERIFEPFVRAANAAALDLPGVGLGLHVSQQIVELHDGRIWAESAGEGHGTTMRVWLPITDTNSQGLTATRTPALGK